MRSATRHRLRLSLRCLLAVAFLFAGWKHVTAPGMFLPIVPGWVPLPRQTVILTGWCEIAGAIALAVPRLRWIAGVMLAIYTACVFPANIDHALRHPGYGVGALGWWYHAPRLALQPVIGWWCLFAGGVIDWPFRAPGRAAARASAPPPALPPAPGSTG